MSSAWAQNGSHAVVKAVLLCLLVLTGCGHNEPVDGADDVRLPELEAKWLAKFPEAATCWVVTGGDGALWSGKYAALTNCQDYTDAEVEPGLWTRSPGYVDENPSPDYSSWSRDMGLGLITWALLRGDLGALERHRDYGKQNGWQMGTPLGDGRSVYTPNIIGTLYGAIHALGGEDNGLRNVPVSYSSGLTDFQAHLAVQLAWLRGRLDGGITDQGLAVLKEQAERDARDPLFQSVYAQYTGDWRPAVDACLVDDYAGEYVRCDEGDCYLAAWLFACSIPLEGQRLQLVHADD